MTSDNLFILTFIITIFAFLVTRLFHQDNSNEILKYTALSLWIIDFLTVIILVKQLVLD